MRLAIIMDLAPRKLGSFEDWIIAMCELARQRGHEVDVYGRTPIHSMFKARLDELAVGWDQLEALTASTPVGIRRLRAYEVIHLNMLGIRSRIAMMSRAAYPSRVIFVDHASGPVPGTATTSHPVVNVVKRSVDRVTMIRVSRLVGVSEYVTSRNRKQFAVRGERARTIYNGVDVGRFMSNHEPRETRALNVTAVAYLIKQKGIDHLVRAVAQARNRELRLIIGGDGPEQGNLAELASELGIADRVEFLGLRDDVPSVLARTDIFVHPAIWEEAFGLTIAEAMAMQRPIIATRIGGIPELIEHQRSGILVEPGNPDEMAQALDLLSEQPALRRRLAENARARAQQAFTLRRWALDHIQCCEESVAPRRAEPAAGRLIVRPSV